MQLRTPLCDRLGIDVPIIGAPMGGYALVELAAAVSAAGGLGMMGLTSYTPGEIAAGALEALTAGLESRVSIPGRGPLRASG